MGSFKEDYASFDEVFKAAEGGCSQPVITRESTTKRIKVKLLEKTIKPLINKFNQYPIVVSWI
jgi:hypothetical protein